MTAGEKSSHVFSHFSLRNWPLSILSVLKNASNRTSMRQPLGSPLSLQIPLSPVCVSFFFWGFSFVNSISGLFLHQPYLFSFPSCLLLVLSSLDSSSSSHPHSASCSPIVLLPHRRL